LQLNGAFTLFDAAATVPYLSSIGVTECYCSPILASRPGSSHGYDVIDHGSIDPELGGNEGLRALIDAARAHDLGIVIDFVPNHMSANASANPWWWSVLENGPSSPYANYFDIDWDPLYEELKHKVLLPILGDHYGATLESGALQLELVDGSIRLRYHDHLLPLNPRQLRLLLSHRLDGLAGDVGEEAPELTEFRSVIFHFEHLPVYTDTDPARMVDRRREKDVAAARLAAAIDRWPRIRRHVEDNIRLFNGRVGESSSFDLLHRLLEAQPYRLASWRTAVHEINYRRFFDVNELAGLRPEDPEVFEALHALTSRLIRDGAITGLRLDHIDGLFDPAGYLRALHAACGDAMPYVVVEKILSHDEVLNTEWLVHGTTGYDFLGDVTGLFIDDANADRFRRVYTTYTGDTANVRDVGYRAKRLIIKGSMASELNVLAYELNRISEMNRQWRDFTLASLQEALREVVACFPVYRTYVSRTEWSSFDERCVDTAIREALRRNPALEPTIFQFIRQQLLPRRTPDGDAGAFERRVRFAMKFQQYTGPVEAKGVEDTAFYRHAPLLSLNEVGSDPGAFGVSVPAFHTRNAHRKDAWPLTMLATATHDTKRGEDARARLNVLSELPDGWRMSLLRWRRLNQAVRSAADGPAPDATDEYFYYQTLLAVWPPGRGWRPDPAFVERIQSFLRKAMREAKTHTSWVNPSLAYENAVLRFVLTTLTDERSAAFRRSVGGFARRIAHLGMLNSLSQLVLKLGSPGVPDFYQGSELWDLSLVDPDNRRAVDFAERRRALDTLAPLLDEAPPADGAVARERLLEQWANGHVKMFTTVQGLRLRRQMRDVFLFGTYRPVDATGARARHVVSFVRHRGRGHVLVVVPRLVARLTGPGKRWPVGAAVWRDTALKLPTASTPLEWRNVFTGETRTTEAGEACLPVADALASFPVGLFVAVAAT
jgi:(1->4)-alpha-D-glucan 1-alpha-D-glucosylmutase